MTGGLIAVVDDQMGEVELAGDRESLMRLAQVIRGVAPTAPHVERLAPIPQGVSGIALALLKVSTSEEKVIIAVDAAGDQLGVSGAPEWLGILAENMANFATEEAVKAMGRIYPIAEAPYRAIW